MEEEKERKVIDYASGCQAGARDKLGGCGGRTRPEKGAYIYRGALNLLAFWEGCLGLWFKQGGKGRQEETKKPNGYREKGKAEERENT